MKPSHSPRSHSQRKTGTGSPTRLQLESWRLLWHQLTADQSTVVRLHDWLERRERARPELVALLERFRSADIDLSELRATFDRGTKTQWDLFGLRGMSGSMFLNRLVRYVPDGDALSARLREALPVPAGRDEARRRLESFCGFLDDLARRGDAELRLVQPARAAFFVTIWWHVQDPDRWPAFHLTARRALQLEEGLYAPTGRAVEDYFRFRETWLTLASALQLRAWELEYLCWWSQREAEISEPEESYYEPGRLRTPRPARERSSPVPVVREPAAAEPAMRRERDAVAHTHVQWLLAKIGKRLGCRVWIAANDRRREWQGELLSDLAIRRMPSLGMDADSQRLVSLIDVVWLKGANRVVAAFEVEHTTSVYSGLLRMADLVAVAPNLNFPLYIVSPRERLDKVRRELLRPTFQVLELHRRCAFFASEDLVESADDIMRWGSGPTVIERLARLADGVPIEGG